MTDRQLAVIKTPLAEEDFLPLLSLGRWAFLTLFVSVHHKRGATRKTQPPQTFLTISSTNASTRAINILWPLLTPPVIYIRISSLLLSFPRASFFFFQKFICRLRERERERERASCIAGSLIINRSQILLSERPLMFECET